MATIFNMYKDIATPDVTADIRESRRESEANTKKTQDTAFGMLKRSNIGTLQQQYREGKGRFAGITDPDKKFQVYYDALKALDPQAAQDAANVYGEERQRRINREIADAYAQSGSSGNPDIDNLRKKIDELKDEIAIDEANEQQQKAEAEQKVIEQEQAEEAAVSNVIQRTTPEQARAMVSGSDAGMTIDTGRMNQPIDTELGYSEGELQQDWSKLGYVPLPKYDLRRMYGINPEFDISLSREGTDQVIDPRNQPSIGTGMEGYIPSSRYEGYVPMTRNIATMYRGR